MPKKLAELKQAAAELSDEEKAELALALIESLDGPADPGHDDAWKKEIERRITQIDRGEVEPIPGDQVMARLRRRFG